MFHSRNLIICLSLLIVGLSGLVLRLTSGLAVETAYAGANPQPSNPESLAPAAANYPQAGAVKPLSAPGPEIVPVINGQSTPTPQLLGSPQRLSAAPLPVPWAIADLDGAAHRTGSRWQATVTIMVVDCVGNPVTHASVFGSWGNSRIATCATDSTGRCTLTSPEVEAAQTGSLTFTVNNLIHSEPAHYFYQATRNTDPDGDSDGTTIVVNQP